MQGLIQCGKYCALWVERVSSTTVEDLGHLENNQTLINTLNI